MDNIDYSLEDLTDHNAIGAVIFDKNKNILMQDHIKFGFWTLPVGKVKPNQTVIEALKAELYEECNIEPIDFEEINSKEYKYVRNNKEVKVNLYLFKINSYKGIIKNKEPQKHKQQIFLSISEILKKNYLSDATLLYLNTLGYNRNCRI